VVWRTVLSDAPGWINSNSSASGFWKMFSTIIHRTVWCSTGLSGVPCGVTATAPTVVCKSEQWSYSARTARVESEQAPEGAPDSEQDLSGAPPDCPVAPTCQSSNGWTLTVGWRGWRTGQCPVAHRTVWCARRQTASPTTTLVVWAINTPNHHTSRHPSFQPTHSIQELVHSIQDTIRLNQNLSKS
jgi:hypothetical protein